MIKEMDYVTGGLGWKVWGTALVLARRLVNLQKMLDGKRVLELGSGCGLCGLLAVKLGASEVILTDNVPDILENLCNNALLLPASVDVCKPVEKDGSVAYVDSVFDYTYKRNTTSLSTNGDSAMVRVRLLDWVEDALESPIISQMGMEPSNRLLPKLGANQKFDWIIGSDLIYDHYNIRSLAGVIKRRLSEHQGQGLFASPVRKNIELDLFLAELDLQGMDAQVEECTEQEWETCLGVLGIEEGGTLHGVDHYEGGLVIVSVRHKP